MTKPTRKATETLRAIRNQRRSRFYADAARWFRDEGDDRAAEAQETSSRLSLAARTALFSLLTTKDEGV